MTAYQFTRFEADRVHTLKARGFDIDIIKMQIGLSNPNKNFFRNTKEYKDAQNTYYDLTMSCSKEEAIEWMCRWMLNAIAYASQTKDLNWRVFFMAAYDIHAALIAS